MKTDTIVCCVVALLLGMLLANMLKNVCGCKLVEGQNRNPDKPVKFDSLSPEDRRTVPLTLKDLTTATGCDATQGIEAFIQCLNSPIDPAAVFPADGGDVA